MTGYEQSPDYGGEPPGEWGFVAFLLVVFVAAPLTWWYFTTRPMPTAALSMPPKPIQSLRMENAKNV